ncbi:unnamed protein product [Lactuca saligna]|uniref:CST complex subunit TEN1 n=1 Tax=Lactuca saligna TaxID=75948 RepID=A0AA35ZE41_LACSI|nr:unnamed protein product [Lactuca saligna]
MCEFGLSGIKKGLCVDLHESCIPFVTVHRKHALLQSPVKDTYITEFPVNCWCFNGICSDSLRVNGKLQEHDVESAIAIIADGGVTLAVDTQHLRLNLRVGSLYQFIGELSIQPNNEGILKARVGRNVDGMDLNLYQQSLKLLRQFQSDQISHLGLNHG